MLNCYSINCVKLNVCILTALCVTPVAPTIGSILGNPPKLPPFVNSFSLYAVIMSVSSFWLNRKSNKGRSRRCGNVLISFFAQSLQQRTRNKKIKNIAFCHDLVILAFVGRSLPFQPTADFAYGFQISEGSS